MALKPLHNERELLAEIAEGNEHAFKIIYNSYRKLVYSSALRLLKADYLAEEVLQEVFLKIWTLKEKLLQIRHLESYLTTLTRNRSLNVLRRIALENSTEKELAIDWAEEHNETEERILLDDFHRILNAGIAELPAKQRQVYQLCYQEGYKYEQVADQLNISPLTVKTHMQHALKFLRVYVRTHSDLAVMLIILKII